MFYLKRSTDKGRSSLCLGAENFKHKLLSCLEIRNWRTIFLNEKRLNMNKNGNGKAVPLQACSGPEGSRKLRFSDIMTTPQDGGKVVSFTHWPP